MMFRPKFCCNCGEKIERVEWRLWTSRRFCDLCSTEYKYLDIVPLAALGGGAFLSVLGLTLFFGVPTEQASMAGTKRPISSAKQLKAAEPQLQNSNTQNTASSSDGPTFNGSGNSAHQNPEQPVRKPITSEDEVFYCGALTKKGTPCTRRVKKKGFCWQHAKSVQIAPARF